MGDDGIFQGKPPLRGEKENGCGGEAFADGKHAVQCIRRAGSVIAFKAQFIMPCEEEAVHGDLFFMKSLCETQDAAGRDTGFFRRGFLKCQHKMAAFLFLIQSIHQYSINREI